LECFRGKLDEEREPGRLYSLGLRLFGRVITGRSDTAGAVDYGGSSCCVGRKAGCDSYAKIAADPFSIAGVIFIKKRAPLHSSGTRFSDIYG